MKRVALILVCALASAWSCYGYDGKLGQIPAFPGAEGGGMYTTGGRGGRVTYVTKLEDDGSEGTLRWAVSQTYPRTILFKVSGVIRLRKTLYIRHGDVTIAGQTAPGDGICISDFGVVVAADNVIIRFMRFRPGCTQRNANINQDALGGRYHRNIIIDHCSMSWSTDECVSFYANENFTLQWCILTESLRNSVHAKGKHGYGGIWGGKNASFHHNLISNHDSRNPRFDHPLIYVPNVEIDEFRGVTDFRNNVIYNWGSNNTYGGEGGRFNMVNNYYIPGPASSESSKTYFINAYGRCRDLSQEGEVYIDYCYPELYLSGNIMFGNQAITENNSAGIKYHSAGGTKKKLLRKPMPINGVSKRHTTTQSAKDARAAIALFSGAVLSRDSVDRRAVYDMLNRTITVTDGGHGSTDGLIDTQDAVGGWENYRSVEPPTDSDSDGIPDYWEVTHGLNPENVDDAALTEPKTGYSHLEIYLNSLVEDIVNKQCKKMP